MPILTPAYPSMNSSFNVSTHSLAVMKDEFKRALSIVKDVIEKGGKNWDPLFEPSDFFAVHQHYLAVDLYASSKEDQQAWCGFGESRLRKLIDSLAYIPPLCRLRAFPKKFPLSFVNSTEKGKFGVSYFVAFDVDPKLLRNTKEVSIDSSVDYFKQNDLYRWQKRTEGMDVKITPVVWKNLPDYVFEDMGGKVVARRARREYLRKKKEDEVTEAQKLAPTSTEAKSVPHVSTIVANPSIDVSTSNEDESSQPSQDDQNGPLLAVSPVKNEIPSERKVGEVNKAIEEKSPQIASRPLLKRTRDDKEPINTMEIPQGITISGQHTSPPKRRKMKITFGKLH